MQADAVRALASPGAGTVVCGHAHRPGDEIPPGPRWIVLDAWGGSRPLSSPADDGLLEVTTWRASRES